MNKIAIIEDDIDICNMIAKFLENNKYIVHYALNGAEGIELCKSLVPDLIILDIMLPKLNGNDVLQRLRKFTNAPVIVVSAKTMVQTKIDLLKLGADDYMTREHCANSQIICTILLCLYCFCNGRCRYSQQHIFPNYFADGSRR